jgi:hypothetical protein
MEEAPEFPLFVLENDDLTWKRLMSLRELDGGTFEWNDIVGEQLYQAWDSSGAHYAVKWQGKWWSGWPFLEKNEELDISNPDEGSIISAGQKWIRCREGNLLGRVCPGDHAAVDQFVLTSELTPPWY